MIPIREEPCFEAWKSFSIVTMEVNYFGFGDEETWLNFIDKLGEGYYEEYLQIHEKLVRKEILKDNRIDDPYFHKWDNSSAGDKFKKEMKYRGWFKDYSEIWEETYETLANISYGLKY
jgi:hypothetical protein